MQYSLSKTKSIFHLLDDAPRPKPIPTGPGNKGLTLKQVWGTNFSMQGIQPMQAAILVVAHAFNLSGARALGQEAPSRELLCYRQCAEYVQRHYKQNPKMKVAILGKGEKAHMHCIVIDERGVPLYDSAKNARLSFAAERRLYTYVDTVQGKKSDPWTAKAIGEVSLLQAVQYLDQQGFWVDKSQSNTSPRPRGDGSI